MDVDRGLSVELLATGWKDAGVVQGKTKLVPSASVKVKNVSAEKLPAVQVNAVFRRSGDPGEWGSVFVPASGWAGLTAGGATTLTLNAPYGYTGEENRDIMLRNHEFVDATVDVFAKYGAKQWVRLGAFPIDRRLLR